MAVVVVEKVELGLPDFDVETEKKVFVVVVVVEPVAAQVVVVVVVVDPLQLDTSLPLCPIARCWLAAVVELDSQDRRKVSPAF